MKLSDLFEETWEKKGSSKPRSHRTHALSTSRHKLVMATYPKCFLSSIFHIRSSPTDQRIRQPVFPHFVRPPCFPDAGCWAWEGRRTFDPGSCGRFCSSGRLSSTGCARSPHARAISGESGDHASVLQKAPCKGFFSTSQLSGGHTSEVV